MNTNKLDDIGIILSGITFVIQAITLTLHKAPFLLLVVWAIAGAIVAAYGGFMLGRLSQPVPKIQSTEIQTKLS